MISRSLKSFLLRRWKIMLDWTWHVCLNVCLRVLQDDVG
jgi:hypothetical protein